MIWAAIGLEVKTPLVFIERDTDSIRNSFTAQSYLSALEEGLIPVYSLGRLFQQDNARIYLASLVQDQFETHRVQVIKWPACSPDLNLIKHAWKALKQQLYTLYPNLDELKNNEADLMVLRARIEEAWERVDQRLIRRLVALIPKRLRACKRAGGWYIKY